MQQNSRENNAGSLVTFSDHAAVLAALLLPPVHPTNIFMGDGSRHHVRVPSFKVLGHDDVIRRPMTYDDVITPIK